MNVILSIATIGTIVYNYDKIKLFLLKQKGDWQAREITINFFLELLRENNDINLPDAILKYEDSDNKYRSLDELSAARFRPYDAYIEAYFDLFEEAKRRNY